MTKPIPAYPQTGAASGPDFPAFPLNTPAPGRVLILGAGAMQIPAIMAARAEGLTIILADGNPQAMAIPYGDEFLHIDLKDKDAMLEGARKLKAQGGLDGIFTAATDFSATVAWVSQNLGLPGITWETACNASLKARMRRVFKENNIPSPHFAEILKADWQARSDLSCTQGLVFPLVVKPVDNMGARGVRKVESHEGLFSAVNDAMAYARSAVIVEEFIQGPEFSIDSMVIDGVLHPCGIADRHICFPPYFIEVGHTIPTSLSPADQAELVRVFSLAVAALGIRNGVAKGDVFMTSRGPVIGEIAARLSGGYMSGWTFPWSSGLDLTRWALRQALGRPIQLPQFPWNQVVAERALISIPGQVQALIHTCDLSSIPGFKAWFPRCMPGDRVIFPRNNVEKAGNIIAQAPSRAQAVESSQTAVASLVLELAPQDTQTDRFLFAPEPNQPRAFPALEAAILQGSLQKKWGSSATLKAVLESDAQVQLDTEPDWTWRTLSASLELCSRLRPEFLFWERGRDHGEMAILLLALSRGGLQGALYALDSFWAPGAPSWKKRIQGMIHAKA